LKNVKITVLRKLFLQDFSDIYLAPENEAGPCPLVQEGQVFLYTGSAEMPAGFCPWAWIDIYRGVNALSAGASYTPWNRTDGQQVLCCTDGVRPVVFLLEALGAE